VIRDITITTVEGKDVEGSWKEIAQPGHTITTATFCEFGLAEEVIGLIEYDKGKCFEVGIGESLREYDRLYLGWTEREAEERFWQAVTLHARNM
jgi:hypothetical protein